MGQQSRHGQAEFRVFTRGRLHSSLGMAELGTAVTTWSLGFQETEPGVWKVGRISPVSMPEGIPGLPGGRVIEGESPFGFTGKIRGFPARGRGKIAPGMANNAAKSHSHVECVYRTKLADGSRAIRLVLEIRVFQYDQLVFLFVVAVFLVWRKLEEEKYREA